MVNPKTNGPVNQRVAHKPQPRSKFDENATVSGTAVPFHHLVDQKLREDPKSNDHPRKSIQPRKFLKRGEGLKRFGEKFATTRWKLKSPGNGASSESSKVVERGRVNQNEVPVRQQALVPRKPRESTDSEVKVSSFEIDLFR
jgi:hypothetical protein